MNNRVNNKKLKRSNQKPKLPKQKPKLSTLAKAIFISVVGVGLTQEVSHAVTITVNSNADELTQSPDADPNICSLREAINSINSQEAEEGCAAGNFGNNDRIVFNGAVSTIELISPLRISEGVDVSIDASNLPGGITIDASSGSGIDINAATVTIDNITIRGARFGGLEASNASNVTINNSQLIENEGSAIEANSNSIFEINNTVITGNSGPSGAGIDVNNGSYITLNESLITQNSAVLGGGVSLGNGSTVIINNSTISQNTATSGGGLNADEGATLVLNNSVVSENNGSNGGGITVTDSSSLLIDNGSVISNNIAAGSGGGVFSITDATITINDSSISDNSAASSGAGLAATSSTFVMTGSTISDNSAQIVGGGLYFSQSNVTINNSTVSGNNASLGFSNGGGLRVVLSSSVAMRNVTFSENSAAFLGGGMYVGAGTSTVLINTIIANSNGADDCSGPGIVTTDSASIIENDQCGTNARNLDPLLFSLSDNGGPTLTHRLSINSPALNSGSASTCLNLDQRGFVRGLSDGFCDIGAFELNADTGGDGGGGNNGGGGGNTGNNGGGNGNADFFHVIPLPNNRAVVLPL